MRTYSKGIFSSDHKEAREHGVELLAKAYGVDPVTQHMVIDGFA